MKVACNNFIDHFPEDIDHFPRVIDHFRRVIDYFPIVIDHFPGVIVILLPLAPSNHGAL
ncbi:hypothetical protein QNH10_03325 [Sporosarcina thermotolerans]|uniref:hypothetical protein n=1 Tax=Sporosarcina thermotolerans TaxID=633404 RepID=UPI0024BC32A1|nr:hypothetical protein [Sporosarcina thermotolerans]WHT48790.1 hypothetical protein QNH10_03325 [Sporosarcina thermotolerans]